MRQVLELEYFCTSILDSVFEYGAQNCLCDMNLLFWHCYLFHNFCRYLLAFFVTQWCYGQNWLLPQKCQLLFMALLCTFLEALKYRKWALISRHAVTISQLYFIISLLSPIYDACIQTWQVISQPYLILNCNIPISLFALEEVTWYCATFSSNVK